MSRPLETSCYFNSKCHSAKVLSYRAFTLIELLVVIAIIALLVSILLPSLKKAKELAKGVVCASNQKSCGTAMFFYSNDYSGVVGMQHSDNNILIRWLQFLDGGTYLPKLPDTVYLEDSNVAKCPSDTEKFKSPQYTYGSNCQSTYASLSNPTGANSALTSYVSLAKIANPADYWFLGDSWSSNDQDQCFMIYIHPSWSGIKGGFLLRHLGRANTLFSDGHVNSLTDSEVFNLGTEYNRQVTGLYDEDFSFIGY